MITQEEINRLNSESAELEMMDAERRGSDKAEIMADDLINRPPRRSPHYFKEDTKKDHLREIQQENVEASHARINHHE